MPNQTTNLADRAEAAGESETREVLTDEQRQAVLEGRVHDCPYNHPKGTRCPNCAKWPFKKGGAAEFVAACLRAEAARRAGAGR